MWLTAAKGWPQVLLALFLYNSIKTVTKAHRQTAPLISITSPDDVRGKNGTKPYSFRLGISVYWQEWVMSEGKLLQFTQLLTDYIALFEWEGLNLNHYHPITIHTTINLIRFPALYTDHYGKVHHIIIRSWDEHHEKTDLKVFVVVIPKDGLAGWGPPILL